MENLVPWATLKSVPGIGNLLFKRLFDHFGTIEAVLAASKQALLEVHGMSPRLASAIGAQRASEALLADLARARNQGVRILTLADAAYPRLLLEIPDPPPMLYVQGSLEELRCPVAVVGSRHPTDYGITTTYRLCADLASQGVTIISGGARGIDTAAHTGALSAAGKTVAVLGSGLEKIYPAENRRLFSKIARHGAVVSEFAMEAGPDAHHFPQRNRIISGMALGVVIVEASRKSGSLITARLAADQGREVFAVPGSIHSFKSAGTHGLIKEGAKLVEHAQDVVEELNPGRAMPDPEVGATVLPPPVSTLERRVLDALGPYPVHIDKLVRQLEIDAGTLSGLLLALELKGLVRQSPGKFFTNDEC